MACGTCCSSCVTCCYGCRCKQKAYQKEPTKFVSNYLDKSIPLTLYFNCAQFKMLGHFWSHTVIQQMQNDLLTCHEVHGKFWDSSVCWKKKLATYNLYSCSFVIHYAFMTTSHEKLSWVIYCQIKNRYRILPGIFRLILEINYFYTTRKATKVNYKINQDKHFFEIYF